MRWVVQGILPRPCPNGIATLIATWRANVTGMSEGTLTGYDFYIYIYSHEDVGMLLPAKFVFARPKAFVDVSRVSPQAGVHRSVTAQCRRTQREHSLAVTSV